MAFLLYPFMIMERKFQKQYDDAGTVYTQQQIQETPFLSEPDLIGLQNDTTVTRPIYIVWEELFL